MPGHAIEFVQNLQTGQSNRKLQKGIEIGFLSCYTGKNVV